MALDILIAIVVAAGLIIGFTRGILGQIAGLVGIVCGIVAARLFGTRVADFLGGLAGSDTLDRVIGYVLVFIAAYLLGWVITKVFKQAVHSLGLGIVDRIAGAIIKAAIYAFVLSIALNIYLIFKPDKHDLDAPGKPWRTAVVEFAPKVLGF